MKRHIVRHLLRTAFTGKDNDSYDLVKILTAIISLTYVGLSSYTAIHLGTFSMVDFGIGYGTILSGSGLAIKLKEDSEPESIVTTEIQ